MRRIPGDLDEPDDESDGEPPDELAPAPGAPPDRLASVSGLMASVSTAYTAAHGHPLEHDGLISRQVRRRRWSVGVRTAVIASLAVALVTGVVVVRDLARTSGTPMSLAQVDPGSAGAATGPGAEGTDPGSASGGQASGKETTADPQTTDPPAGAALVVLAVHVVGQVNSPGVVEVAPGSRVIDAITAAGGLTAGADPGAVNLARPVVDGEQIYVPAPGEQVPVAAGQPAAAQPTVGAAPGAAQGTAAINLNTADAVALDALPGIGPALAGRIVAWREQNGGFGAIDDLLEVSGIGPAVLSKIRDLVTV
ncbi:competence protein ComEA [Sanguibacter gelidistatuariae]|uniref:Competence protein ComEA n=1 Tax=Sanguibacter gelidistatuariae TaxID=1814289 RepID=A0A1G6RYL7_9MICO|nr:ComEA family DNA-binding protein [Sanguibacter gelidistatuariae]SDD09047.1 competence protein ComEA [Sanguibacter gelidistatuariae]